MKCLLVTEPSFEATHKSGWMRWGKESVRRHLGKTSQTKSTNIWGSAARKRFLFYSNSVCETEIQSAGELYSAGIKRFLRDTTL